MSERHNEPVGEALDWVGRIFAVTMVMVSPGLGGQWLDRRLGTGFLAMVGFALGVSLGIWYLIVATRRPDQKQSDQDEHVEDT